ncbi:heme oxygenase [Solibacillus sp. CAU 1738]|uniref:heme oxygenase n=1 Tax=Solibacillus sp. CAU 1738 TaxID=3140363 RepID=UPI003260D061
MITVTNRIQVKKGMAMKMAPNFTQPGPLQQYEGFHKVEVHVSTQFDEYDEMNVMMYWDSIEAFEVWRNSEDFKATHKRPSAGDEPNPNSPLIKSLIVISEIASSISK